MNKAVDDNLIEQQLREDNKEALKRIYLMYMDEFLNYAKRYPLEQEDVLDIYQDATIAMHQNFVVNKLVLESSTIKTYLFGIGKNKLFQILKKRNRLITTEIKDDSIETIELEEPIGNPRIELLSKKVASLSPSCQTLLRLFYYRNLTIDEIVDQTDYKDGNTVRSHKSRCIKRLKELFNVT